jgi:hypothetical protein
LIFISDYLSTEVLPEIFAQEENENIYNAVKNDMKNMIANCQFHLFRSSNKIFKAMKIKLNYRMKGKQKKNKEKEGQETKDISKYEMKKQKRYLSTLLLCSSLVFKPIIEQWSGTTNWKLLYKGSREGFSVKDFHSYCDNKGSTLTIVSSSDNFSIGVYTPLAWESSGGSCKDAFLRTFIFTLTNPHDIIPTQYKLKHRDCAIIFNSDLCPILG